MKSPDKVTQLSSILSQELGGNKARLTLLSHLVLSMLKVRDVNFRQLATGYYNGARLSSRVRRIQRFFRQFRFERRSYGRLLMRMMPVQGSYPLSLDRTNWKLGGRNINLLFLSVIYQGVGIPIFWCVLGDKRGNSSQEERILLLSRFMEVFGSDSIEYLTADREFIGKKWLSFLESRRIRFYIRIRKDMLLGLGGGKKVKAYWLLMPQPRNHAYFHPKVVWIKGVQVYLSGTKFIGQDGKLDYLILVSYNKREMSLHLYRKRWQIEMMFKAFKSSGFNLENTHIHDYERLDTLIGVLAIAFIWAYNTGVYLNESVRKIAVKKHGRKEVSIFKYGLDHLAEILINQVNKLFKKVIPLFLSCT